MKRSVLSILVITFLLTGCSKEQSTPTENPEIPKASLEVADNPRPESWGDLAPMDLTDLPEPPRPRPLPASPDPGLSPAMLMATLAAGETVTEHKVVELPETPPKGDVLFAFDLTGSMGGELNNVKTNGVNIMNAVAGVIADVQFGLISHEDYQGFFDSTPFGCSYANNYGSPSAPGGGDQPYRLEHVLTSSTANVATAIGGMILRFGSDGPESYSRALFESYAELTAAGPDPTFGPIGWRPGAKKIVVAFNDNIPHDCNVDAIIGGSGDTGIDPGRDATLNTADDLEIIPVLDGMAAANVTLINIHSGSQSSLWQAYAAKTGGVNFQINSNGTFPAGVDPAAKIAELIEAEVSTVDELVLAACHGDESFSDWIRSSSPSSHTDITLPATLEFDIEVGPPEGTEDGEFHFDICALGDGVEFGRQTVWITVRNVIDVAVDIKPQSCPNPLNVKGGGVLPAAILGTDEFDVTQVDPMTVQLEGVSALRWNLEDVATPFDGALEGGDDCATEGADGFTDLTLKFDKRDVVAALGPVNDRDVLLLTLTGNLKAEFTGTKIEGQDVVVILK